jgi:hypothetical protein
MIIEALGLEIQIPTFNVTDYDPNTKSIMGYNVRFNKRITELIEVTLDNCTGIQPSDKIVPENDLQITFDSTNIMIPVQSGPKSSFDDVYNDAEFHMVLITKNQKDTIMDTIYYLVWRGIHTFKEDFLDNLQIHPITTHEIYSTKKGRSTSKPFPFLYKKILVFTKPDENIYFLTLDHQLHRRNLIERVFCNIQATICTKLRYCLDVMNTITEKWNGVNINNTSDANNYNTFTKAHDQIIKRVKTQKPTEIVRIITVLVYYGYMTRNFRKSYPFILRHSTYDLFQILSQREKNAVLSLLPENTIPYITPLIESKNDQAQGLTQTTVFKLSPKRLDTLIYIEVRYLQYLLSAKVGNTTNPMLNNIHSLLHGLKS